MSMTNRVLSAVRENSRFASPPRVLVVADEDTAGEALALAEALDEYGAEAEVRLMEDTTADEYGAPDAVIVAGAKGAGRAHGFATAKHHPVLVALADGDRWRGNSEFDLVMDRRTSASALLERLGGYLLRS
jgi:hypothetical protein